MKLTNPRAPGYYYARQTFPLFDKKSYEVKRFSLIFLMDFGDDVRCANNFTRSVKVWPYDWNFFDKIQASLDITIPNIFDPLNPLETCWEVEGWESFNKESFIEKIPLLKHSLDAIKKLKEHWQRLQHSRFSDELLQLEKKAKQNKFSAAKAFNAQYFQELNETDSCEALLLKWLESFQYNPQRPFLDNLYLSIHNLERLAQEQLDAFVNAPALKRLHQQLNNLNDTVAFARGWERIGDYINIELINVRESELATDFANSSDITQSGLYKKLHHRNRYEDLRPPSVLVYDGHFGLHNLDVLRKIAAVCNISKTVFIAQVCPSMFDVTGFEQLSANFDFEQHFSQDKFNPWHQWRSTEPAQQVVLMVGEHRVIDANGNHYLCSDSYFLGVLLILRFYQNEWFYTLEGRFKQNAYGGGVFPKEGYGARQQSFCQVAIPLHLERKLNLYGFCVLKDIQFSQLSIINYLPTLYRTQATKDEAAIERATYNLRTVLNKNIIIHSLFCMYQHYVWMQGLSEEPNYQRTKRILLGWIQDLDNQGVTDPSYEDIEMKPKPWQVLDCDYKEIEGQAELFISAKLSLCAMLDAECVHISFGLDLAPLPSEGY